MVDAYHGLGLCYQNAGEYARALKMHEQAMAVAEEVGERAKVAAQYSNIGICHKELGNYKRALKMHEQHKAMAEELGVRAQVAIACSNLGICHGSLGDHRLALLMHEEARAIEMELGDRSGLAYSAGNLGACYQGMGDFPMAIALFEEFKAMAEEMGDRRGVASAYGNLGGCHFSQGDYDKAIACLETKHAIAQELGMAHREGDAALALGIVLRHSVRAELRGRAAGASQLPGPQSSSSTRADVRLREAERWLQTALLQGRHAAQLHLAHLVFDAGKEDEAIAHLKNYLSWSVVSARAWCAGCHQRRSEDVELLTCGGCRVAKFCSAEHQKATSF